MAHVLEADKTKLQIANWRINVTKLTYPELIYYCDYCSIPMSLAARIIWNLVPKRSPTFLRITEYWVHIQKEFISDLNRFFVKEIRRVSEGLQEI